jgi:nucleoside-triphosphatase
VKLLLTGRPGIGKTTVVEQVVKALSGVRATGFFTREIREKGRRRGFAIHTLDGRMEILADVGAGVGPRVGRYRVLVESLDYLAAPAIVFGPGVELVVIDEIGTMECCSPRFCDAVRAALDAPASVMATIAQRGEGLIRETRARGDLTMREVTVQNREALPAWIADRLQRRRPVRA